LNPRTFNAICILAIVAVGAMAIFMVQASADMKGTGPQAAAEVQEVSSAQSVMLQPLSLGLSLAVVADLGLMTVGLVILFKEDAPGRDRSL
jgi:hypothetical protein